MNQVLPAVGGHLLPTDRLQGHLVAAAKTKRVSGIIKEPAWFGHGKGGGKLYWRDSDHEVTEVDFVPRR